MVDKRKFIVEMKIKENRGKFTPKIDTFKGTADEARDLLDIKYCSHKGALFNFVKFWEVGSKEIEQFSKELETKFCYRKKE